MSNDYLAVETSRLAVHTDFDTCLTEMTVHGRWDSELRSAVAYGLRACLAETPRAVLVDLADLVDPTGASAATWHTGGEYAATRPAPVDIALCAVPAPVMQRLIRVDSDVRIAGSLTQARAQARRPGPAYRRRMTLPPAYQAAALGRAMVTDALAEWRLLRLADPARLILHELIVNAVEHADTEMVAAVSIRGSALHLAVCDEEPALPYLRMPDPAVPDSAFEQRGAGLRMVRTAATTWGALPCAVGKVVWACMSFHRSGTSHDPIPWRRT